MRSHRNLFFLTASIATLATTALAFLSLGAGSSRSSQTQTKGSHPASLPSGRSPAPHTLYCGLWRTDGGFVSTAHIKNVLVTARLQITPVIYTADGTEYDLQPLNLQAGGIANLNVNDSLRDAPAAVQTHLSDFGTLALRFVSQSSVNVAASMQILNEPQSLTLTVPFHSIDPTNLSAKSAALEAVWWKHDPGVRSFVAVSNASESTKEISLEVLGSQGSVRHRALTLDSKNTRTVDLEPLLSELPEAESQTGGIRVRYEGQPQEVSAAGGLLNDAEGYSATLEFQSTTAMRHSGQSEPSSFSWASVGIMVGAPDPMMGFPKNTVFAPYAVLRNSTDHELEIEPVLYLMAGSQMNKISLPELRLKENESRQLSLDSALSNFSGMATLVLSYQGMAHDLLVATGSVDQTGTYVFEVPPNSAAESWAKQVPYWSVADGFDVMTTVFNSGDTAEDIVATLTYAGGTGHYSLPLHLASGEAQMLDVRDLIDMQQPDASGNVIPRDIQQGSITFASPKGIAELIHLAISSGLFNVQTATCGGLCQICTTTTSTSIDPSLVPTPLGGSQQATFTLYLSDGSTADKTPSANWSSGNTAIATVQSQGSSSPGMTNGVAVGTATLFAFTQGPTDEPQPQCPSSCPISIIGGSGPATVVWVTLSLRTGFGQAPSSDNSKSGQYLSSLGSLNTLGTFFSTGTSAHLWRMGVEIVGTVSPSNFTGTIILQRKVDATCTYNVSTLISPCSGPFPDTSDPSFRDDDPQSGGSNGIVYDLDAPALGTGSSPVNTLLRVRTNFRQWATLNGVPVSYDFLWYSRISVIKSSSGDNLANDVAGDSTAGTGTTNLSWNLQ